jgi:hypothetical protein
VREGGKGRVCVEDITMTDGFQEETVISSERRYSKPVSPDHVSRNTVRSL